MTDRYQRQVSLPQIGSEGQKKIAESSIAVVGLGALGSVSANLLARAGAGRLRLIDRDLVELQNLQRQVLYDEDDVRQNLPKAVAARKKLRAVNSEIKIEAEAADLNPGTVDGLFNGIDLILDGTDNFETRFLINDYSLREKKPWIYGAAVGTEGLAYVILPGEGPCLRCLFEDAPQPGEFSTCDTAGILASAAHTVAAFQVTEALKILCGKEKAVARDLWKFDIWKNQFRSFTVGAPLGGALENQSARAGTRPAPTMCSGCAAQDYPYLTREKGVRTVALCGRNAVQILQEEGGSRPVNFPNLAQRLSTLGRVQYNEYLLKASVESFEITVFSNGRAIVSGTEDEARAKSVYARYIGG